ncbi:MAG: hypothetical protein HZA46_24610 [Planctomycetales bacterium]|nr:hypothetical protein [Planctomycetales bacterium]
MNRTVVCRISLWLVSVVCCAGIGCQRTKPVERVPTFPVKGQVLVGGQPADKARVILSPVNPGDDQRQWPVGYPRGIVKSDGMFLIGTYELSDGAPAGDYVALIEWPVDPPQPATATTDGGQAVLVDAGQPDVDDERQGTDRLRGVYFDKQTSSLKVTVEKRENSLSPFHLQLP